MSTAVDIGSGVTIYFTEYSGQVVGLIEEHIDTKGEKCSGYVAFRHATNPPGERPSWIVESMEPLTLSPSILCSTCGHHGFIRKGRWCPA